MKLLDRSDLHWSPLSEPYVSSLLLTGPRRLREGEGVRWRGKEREDGEGERERGREREKERERDE